MIPIATLALFLYQASLLIESSQAEGESAPPAIPLIPYSSQCDFTIAIGNRPIGVIQLGLFKQYAPRTVANFQQLCAGGLIYSPPEGGPNRTISYRNTVFHRVVPDFVIQGGDITNGDGSGGMSIYGKYFKDESLDKLRHYGAGWLSMANAGPDTNNSQFFITLRATDHLNNKHAVFGKVVNGMDVVRKIAATRLKSGTSQPAEPVRVTDTKLRLHVDNDDQELDKSAENYCSGCPRTALAKAD